MEHIWFLKDEQKFYSVNMLEIKKQFSGLLCSWTENLFSQLKQKRKKKKSWLIWEISLPSAVQKSN